MPGPRSLPIAVAIGSIMLPPVAAAAEAEPRTALMPITVDGEISDGWRRRMQTEMASGLDSAGIEIVAPADVTEAAGVSKCANATCYRDLAASVDAPLVIRAHVKLVERNYEVYVESIDGADGSFASSAKETCRLCGVSEVGEMLGTLATGLHHEFFPAAEPASEPAPAPVEDAPVEDTPEPSPPPKVRKWMAPTGWAFVGVGVASLAAGATFLAIHHRPYEAKCSGPDLDPFGNCRQRYDTLGHGAGLTAAGSALLVTGIVFVVVSAVQKKRARRADSATAARLRALPWGRF